MDLSAVQAALSDKSYSALAPLCDELLLQVPFPASLPEPHPTSAQGLAPRLTRFASQAAAKGATTDEWPYSVHLLAHLYINDLYAIRRPCPRFSSILFWLWG
jgi:COP9 signalosome complex subunit 8